MHVQFNSLSGYAESLKLITSAVFLFRVIENCKSALSEKMENIGLHEVILNLKCLSHKEVHEGMVATLWEGAPFYTMAKKWSAEHDPCPGGPHTQKTIDNPFMTSS